MIETKTMVKKLSDFLVCNNDGFEVFVLDNWMFFMQLNRVKNITFQAKTKSFEFKADKDFSTQVVKFLDDSGCLEEETLSYLSSVLFF